MNLGTHKMHPQSTNGELFSSSYEGKLMQILSVEMDRIRLSSETTNPRDYERILVRFKMQPSYQKLLKKLKDKTKQILGSMRPEQMEKVIQLLNHSTNEAGDDCCATLGEILNIGTTNQFDIEACSDPPDESDEDEAGKSDENDDGNDDNENGSSPSSSRGSSATLRAQSPLERENFGHAEARTSSTVKGHSVLHSNSTPYRVNLKKKDNGIETKVLHTRENPTSDQKKKHRDYHQQQQQQEQKQGPQNQSRVQRPPLQMSQSFSDVESSFSSCFNQSGFTVLNQDQLLSLASALDRNQSQLINRQQALRHLVHLPIIDIQACEAWSTPGLTADGENRMGIVRDDSPPEDTLHRSYRIGERVTWADPDSVSMKKRPRNLDVQSSPPPYPLVSGGNLRSGLADALNDPDETLWSLALRYISKGLSTTPPNILETYGLLMDYLTYQFNTTERKLPLVHGGVNIARYPVDRLLRACHLMDQFHRTITHYWIRHSEKFLNEIITRCVDFLSIGCPDQDDHASVSVVDSWPSRLFPMHLLSLVDPQARWFSKWMHGTYSRVPLVDRLKQNRRLVNLIVSVLHRFLRTSSKLTTISTVTEKTKKLEYTHAEMEYALFVHTVNMSYHLLCHSVSRNLFTSQGPPDQTSPYSISALVRMMLDYLRNQIPPVHVNGSGSTPFQMTAQCLMELAKHPRYGASCFAHSFAQTNGCILDGSQPLNILTTGLLDLFPKTVNAPLKWSDSARMIKAIAFANILRNLASHSRGREILHQCNILIDQSQSFMDCLLCIVRTALTSDSDLFSTDRSVELMASLIDLCGLMNTLSSNGKLHSIFPVYHLVLQTWKVLTSRIGVKPDETQRPTKKESHCSDLDEWHFIIKRNLIQVAESPIGVIMLEWENLLDDCAAILHTAHQERMKCHWVRSHFCGFILTQIASRISGARALQSTGLLRRLISEAWKAIEFPHGPNPSSDGTDTYQSASVTSSPPNWPIDPIDSFAYKPFINLVKLTSSFEAIAYFLLFEEKENRSNTHCLTLTPESLWRFLDRSVVLSSEEKMRSLYNLEQTHTFALRLLSCIVSDLDSMLLLCTQFDLLRVLIQMQLETFAPNAQGHTSLDALVLERNYLLVKCYFCGGPTERNLPNRFLCEHGTNPYPHPLIVRPPNVDDPAMQEYFMTASGQNLHCDQFPCKSWYENLFQSSILLGADNSCPTESKLLRGLQHITCHPKRLIDSPESAQSWIEQCYQMISDLESEKISDPKSTKKEMDIGTLLQNCLLARQYSMELFDEPTFDRLSDDSDSFQTVDLSPFEMFGVEIAVRYGQRIGVLPHDSLHPLTDSGHVASLINLLKRVSCGLDRERRCKDLSCPEKCSSDSAPPHYLDESHGFDWFTATIFLAFRGDANRAWEFLAHFAADPLSVYIWPRRAQMRGTCLHGDLVLNYSSLHLTGHFIDHILALECPNIYNTFVLAEIPPSQIARRWVKQCFWNYLDWSGIMDYLILCLLHPKPFHHIYFVLAILRHLRHAVRLATAQSPTDQQQQPQQLVIFLQEEPIRGFQACDHLSFFCRLDSKYGEELKTTIAQHMTRRI
ncbi:hypothetical protein FGIG_00518 [Fasciola gigantica]|uniref:Protein broad-minded n=1 Tax=Fasciola gigantica TaxID=46835 RepID=A0A504Z1P8_FASGI|nr:hypothetical protein FGIG_00518 [Fasciola gigantica]